MKSQIVIVKQGSMNLQLKGLFYSWRSKYPMQQNLAVFLCFAYTAHLIMWWDGVEWFMKPIIIT